MDHNVAVDQNMTERYLLGELEPAAREDFEEHFFGCTDCAFDVRAGAMFVENSKAILAEKPATNLVSQPATTTVAPKWLAWMRPAFVVPVMALLLAFVAYQNLITLPHLMRRLNNPSVLPFASVNVGTYGSNPAVVTASPGEDFVIFLRIPPESGYSFYKADLYNPAGKLEWSVKIAAAAAQDQWPIHVPGANRSAGSYVLEVNGINAGGESKELGRASFELQTKK